MCWRAGLITKNGESIAKNFDSKEDADIWVLEQAEKVGIKKAIIVNKENIKDREIINF